MIYLENRSLNSFDMECNDNEMATSFCTTL